MLVTTFLSMYFGKFSITTLVAFFFTIVFYTITFRKLFRNSIFTTIIKSLATYLIAYFMIIFIISASTLIYIIILKSRGLF